MRTTKTVCTFAFTLVSTLAVGSVALAQGANSNPDPHAPGRANTARAVNNNSVLGVTARTNASAPPASAGERSVSGMMGAQLGESFGAGGLGAAPRGTGASGGTGQGTIGLGYIGTIGHGAGPGNAGGGYGYGRGGMTAPRVGCAAAGHVEARVDSITEPVPRASVERTLRLRECALVACFRRSAERAPRSLNASMTIFTGGYVREAPEVNAPTVPQPVRDCVAETLRTTFYGALHPTVQPRVALTLSFTPAPANASAAPSPAAPAVAAPTR